MRSAIFVTGVSIGNGGYAIAERFAQEGWGIYLTSRKKEQADRSKRLFFDKKYKR